MKNYKKILFATISLVAIIGNYSAVNAAWQPSQILEGNGDPDQPENEMRAVYYDDSSNGNCSPSPEYTIPQFDDENQGAFIGSYGYNQGSP